MKTIKPPDRLAEVRDDVIRRVRNLSNRLRSTGSSPAKKQPEWVERLSKLSVPTPPKEVPSKEEPSKEEPSKEEPSKEEVAPKATPAPPAPPPPQQQPSPAPAKESIDPRFKARRIAVKRDEGRKRLRRLYALGAAFALIFVGYVVTRTPFLDVDRIEVIGASHTPAEVIQQASGIARHQAMTDVQLGRAREQIAALPWVHDVKVSRHWPSTIRVEVTERTAVAAVADADGVLVLVDGDGRLLERVDGEVGVVQLVDVPSAGEPGTELDPAAHEALAIAAQLPPALAPLVARVAPVDDGVDLHLAERGKIVLGSPEDLPAKFTAAMTVLEQVELAGICAIDVRVPSAPSLTRWNSCA